jgi:hypothetical protein
VAGQQTNNRLTPEEQQDIAWARRQRLTEKNQVIRSITANEQNPYSKGELEQMTLNQLQKLSKLAVGGNSQQDPFTFNQRPSFLGTAAPASLPVQNSEAGSDDADMDPPTLNYADVVRNQRSNGRQPVEVG